MVICLQQGADLGPDLQNILRQSYDYLTIIATVFLPSTYNGLLIYKTSYKERKYNSVARDSVRKLACDIPKRTLCTFQITILSQVRYLGIYLFYVHGWERRASRVCAAVGSVVHRRLNQSRSPRDLRWTAGSCELDISWESDCGQHCCRI